MKKLDPLPKRMSEDGLEGKNPTKWHWEKGSWRWGLAKIEALQNMRDAVAKLNQVDTELGLIFLV